MEENLELSLQRVFGGELIRERVAAKASAGPAEKERTDRQMAIEALSHYRKAQELLRQGNWGAYGDELRRMDEILRAVERKR
jgi:hypothetical protein